MNESFLSLIPHLKSNKPQTLKRPIHIIAQSLTTPIKGIAHKNDIPLWSPTVFNGNRSGANAIQVFHLVYDVDDGIAPFSTWRLFSDHYVIAHTSFSHKPEHHKYRIIIPLALSIPASDWSRACIAAKEHWDNTVYRGEPDNKALKDVARIYYRYAHKSQLDKNDPKQDIHRSVVHPGPLFELDYKHIKIEKKQTVPYKTAGKKSMQDIMLDRNFRMAAADKLGAKIQGNNARGIICPNCNRATVYFSIDLSLPNAKKWPTCNHDANCKYWGSFIDLLGGAL